MRFGDKIMRAKKAILTLPRQDFEAIP